jgi:hypothetical protein
MKGEGCGMGCNWEWDSGSGVMVGMQKYHGV